MKTLGLCLTALITLAACAGPAPVSRSAQEMTLATRSLVSPPVQAARPDLRAIRVAVPGALRVSEANVFYPIADIVWRGEPLGNRHEQVARLFQEAAARVAAEAEAAQGQSHGPAILAEIEVTRFHSVTEKTRYTLGGTHAMHYRLTLREAGTGRVLEGPRSIVASVRAAGGAQAVAEDRMGRTQRVVVLEALTQSLRRELFAPLPDLPPNPAPAPQIAGVGQGPAFAPPPAL
jgi:hypothetical protein